LGTMKRIPLYVLLGIALLHTTPALSASEDQDRTSRAGTPQCGGHFTAPITVAVLTPEVVNGEGAVQKKPEHSKELELLLTEKFSAGTACYTLVDRTALDKVLTERAAKLKASAVPTALKPLFQSGIFIVSKRIDAGQTTLIVDAVSTQTGQVIASMGGRPRRSRSRDIIAFLDKQWPAFNTAIKKAAAIPPLPMIWISGQLAKIDNTRLSWMVSDLTASISAAITRQGRVQVCQPRIPLVTKEERLLVVLGLSRPVAGDKPAVWSPVSQYQLTFTLIDETTPNVEFDKSAVTVKLTLHGGSGMKSKSWTERTTVGDWAAAQKRIAAAVVKRLSGAGVARKETAAEAESRARAQSKEIMKQMAGLAVQADDRRYDSDAKSLQEQVLDKALYASHLDPLNHDATYRVALQTARMAMGTETDDEKRSLAKRAFTEMRRFLANRKNLPEVQAKGLFLQAFSLHGKSLWFGASNTPESKRRRVKPLCYPPEGEYYGELSPIIRRIAIYFVQHGKTHRKHKFGMVFAKMLIQLIPSIPDEKIDEEYEFWKTLYIEKIEPAVKKYRMTRFSAGRPYPWLYIDAMFSTRRKDPEGVKRALTQLASQFALNDRSIWGSETSYSNALVPYLLQATGAQDYATWKPTSSTPDIIELDYRVMTRFLERLKNRRASQSAWDLSRAPQLQANPLHLPQSIRSQGASSGWPFAFSRTQNTTLFRVGDNELWIIKPKDKTPSCIYVLTIKESANGVAVTHGEKLDWPAGNTPPQSRYLHPCVAIHKAKPVVLIGTADNRLARFDKVAAQWKGQWIASKEGLFDGPITQVVSVADGNTSRVYLLGRYDTDYKSKRGNTVHGYTYYATQFDLATHQLTLLLKRRADKQKNHYPALKMKNGETWRLNEPQLIPDNLKASDIAEVVWAPKVPAVYPRIVHTPGGLRCFSSWTALHHRKNVKQLTEYDTRSWRTLPSAPGKQKDKTVSLMATRRTQNLMPSVYVNKGAANASLGLSWPAVYAVESVGADGRLWIGFMRNHGIQKIETLVGYKPAPKASRDWAAHDQWIGPFYMPGKLSVLNLKQWDEKHLLLTTQRGIYIVSTAEIDKQMAAAKRVCSTEQWRASRGKPTRRGAARDKSYSLDMQIWKAHGLAQQKKYAESAREYKNAIVMAMKLKDGYAEAFSRIHYIEMLDLSKQYAAVVSAVDEAGKRIPRLKPNGGDPLEKMYQNAKRQMKNKKK
jgi:hypothetical protein